MAYNTLEVGNAEQELPDYLRRLNPEQLKAVLTTEGPQLVISGPGSGKTIVITSKVAHLIHNGVGSDRILAVTFTNKAANEAKHRVMGLMQAPVDGMWIGTFHAIALRILRRHAQEVGLNKDFTIIDIADQLKLIKQVLREQNLDEKQNPPKLIMHCIQKFKDKALPPHRAISSEGNNPGRESMAALYKVYQERLRSLNAVDFGDLLLYNIELFNNNIGILQEYQDQFQYVLVDEYQDTNIAQYLWLRLLVQRRNNICCVGDDDQSIYGWRGAEITNILKFEQDFPDAMITRLEQNYRSTQHILNVASKIVANNTKRLGKELWTTKPEGEKVKVSGFYNDREEARYVAEEVESLQRIHNHKLSDIAVLVRAGYQTRSFEETFNFSGVPYRIIGGIKFFERMEIKDVMSYIRVVVNDSESLAFERIINTPKRGIGLTTIQQMHLMSRKLETSLFTAAEKMLELGEIKGKAAQNLSLLLQNLRRWQDMLKVMSHPKVVEMILNESGYIEMWKSENTEESKERLDNIKEMLRGIQDFASLSDYLEHVSLVTDIDNADDDNKVNMMTMHASKGLEFHSVFLPGWEEGLFPSQRAIDEGGKTSLEEERRLAYVGVTRARYKLYISFACGRRIYGGFQPCTPSRFIAELPPEDCEVVNNYGGYVGSKQDIPTIITEQDQFPSVKQGTKVFKKGDMVNHLKFGPGVIMSMHNTQAEVAFSQHGIKKVLVDYLNG